MRTILVDDEINAIELFQMECADIHEVEIVATFTSPLEVPEYVKTHPVDVAVLDVAMSELDGITLGKQLKEINRQIILIYVSAFDAYAIDAYRLHAPVYLEKPYSKEDIRFAFHTAHQLLLQSINTDEEKQRNVFIRTFDFFDVYVDGELLYFRNKKAKELLALLVDRRGAEVTNEQAISALWETAVNDIYYQSKYRRVVKDLRDTLQKVGLSDIVVSHYNSKAVNTKLFSCDYYWLLDGNEDTKASYSGKYMSEYSWAEDTVADLAWICGYYDDYSGER